MLCNLTLDGLESLLKERFKHRKVNLVRYADDFIVTADTEALLRDEVKPVIEAFLADRRQVVTLSGTDAHGSHRSMPLMMMASQAVARKRIPPRTLRR